MKAVIAFLIIIFSTPSWAVNEPTLVPECAALVAAKAKRQADIGPDYVPGVDVKGKAVVPADGGSARSSEIPDPLVVPVTIDLAERIGVSIDGAKMDATLGFLEIFADGRALYNGQDFTQKINKICYGDRPHNPPGNDGQSSSNIIEYVPVPAANDPAPKPSRKPAPSKVEKPLGELIEGGEYAD